MKEIKRDRYLKQLIDSQQNGFIKVIPESVDMVSPIC